ncbi:MAG: hypothetical protein NPIRA02_31640 [Nitrospirales bacterium]|nr:MAG: hypothetical protein NPIRA02_31640 [Nitrospirales bacterium]
MPWGNERWSRRMHRTIGASSVGILFFMVVTGLLWANAQHTYWDAGYKERVGRIPPVPPVNSAHVLLKDVFNYVQEKTLHSEKEIEEIILRQDFGHLLYAVKLSDPSTPSTLLIDAMTAEPLSLISPNLARIIAQQYVSEESPITSVTMESYTPRKTNIAKEAVCVDFGEPKPATIILDRHSGRILEDESPWRRVHFLVAQLHQLNFFGFNKTLLNIPGTLLLIMSLSGLWLWRLQVIREHRAQQKTSHSEYRYNRPTR